MPINEPGNTVGIYMMTHGPKCIYSRNYIIPMDLDATKRTNCQYRIRDNIGDNISSKGNLYNEITGLYWMWKHNPYEIVGLCHYRRIFPISYKRINRLLKKYDFILPRQYWYDTYPSLEEQYYRVHSKADWEIMKKTLKEMYPEYYESSKKVFGGHFIFGLNMFITHKKLLNAYCEWLFPLLFEIETKININDGRTAINKRAIGILCERLFTLYILHNIYQKKLRIKKILVLDIRDYFTPIVSKKIPKTVLNYINSSNYLSSICHYASRIKEGVLSRKNFTHL